MLATLIASLIALQATGEAPVAVKNDDPETWSVEYPLLIKPQVASYRRCLALTDRRIAGKADFEAQHAGDVTRCTKAREAAITEANAALAGAKTTLPPEEVDLLFTNIGRIHVARGRDLDLQFNARMVGAQAAGEAYEAGRPKGLVIELRDASVVKARTDAAAATAAEKDKDSQ
jgi:hypothetical protein